MCVYLNTFILGISVIDIHISDLCVQAVSAILFKVCFSCIKDLSVIKDTSTLFFLFLVSQTISLVNTNDSQGKKTVNITIFIDNWTLHSLETAQNFFFFPNYNSSGLELQVPRTGKHLSRRQTRTVDHPMVHVLCVFAVRSVY